MSRHGAGVPCWRATSGPTGGPREALEEEALARLPGRGARHCAGDRVDLSRARRAFARS